METLEVPSLDQLDRAADRFLDIIGSHKVIAFEGELGAGKTTFIKKVFQRLGCKDNISSPTYAIVNEYERVDDAGSRQPMFHMDLYRLKDTEEAMDAGIEEYITGDYYCFIEWPALIRSLLPDNTLFTKIEVAGVKNQRKITIFN